MDTCALCGKLAQGGLIGYVKLKAHGITLNDSRKSSEYFVCGACQIQISIISQLMDICTELATVRISGRRAH